MRRYFGLMKLVLFGMSMQAIAVACTQEDALLGQKCDGTRECEEPYACADDEICRRECADSIRCVDGEICDGGFCWAVEVEDGGQKERLDGGIEQNDGGGEDECDGGGMALVLDHVFRSGRRYFVGEHIDLRDHVVFGHSEEERWICLSTPSEIENGEILVGSDINTFPLEERGAYEFEVSVVNSCAQEETQRFAIFVEWPFVIAGLGLGGIAQLCNEVQEEDALYQYEILVGQDEQLEPVEFQGFKYQSAAEKPVCSESTDADDGGVLSVNRGTSLGKGSSAGWERGVFEGGQRWSMSEIARPKVVFSDGGFYCQENVSTVFRKDGGFVSEISLRANSSQPNCDDSELEIAKTIGMDFNGRLDSATYLMGMVHGCLSIEGGGGLVPPCNRNVKRELHVISETIRGSEEYQLIEGRVLAGAELRNYKMDIYGSSARLSPNGRIMAYLHGEQCPRGVDSVEAFEDALGCKKDIYYIEKKESGDLFVSIANRKVDVGELPSDGGVRDIAFLNNQEIVFRTDAESGSFLYVAGLKEEQGIQKACLNCALEKEKSRVQGVFPDVSVEEEKVIFTGLLENMSGDEWEVGGSEIYVWEAGDGGQALVAYPEECELVGAYRYGARVVSQGRQIVFVADDKGWWEKDGGSEGRVYIANLEYETEKSCPRLLMSAARGLELVEAGISKGKWDIERIALPESAIPRSVGVMRNTTDPMRRCSPFDGGCVSYY